MKHMEKSTATFKLLIFPFLAAFVGGLLVVSALAHGPKGHGGQSFTALEAAKKGITLYDKLVAGGKLEESWETGLKEIKVFTRTKDQAMETVVQFERELGDPRSVYIFFDDKGAYSGSNFSGE